MSLLKVGDILYDLVKRKLKHSGIQTLTVIPVKILAINRPGHQVQVKFANNKKTWVPEESLERFKRAPELFEIFSGRYHAVRSKAS